MALPEGVPLEKIHDLHRRLTEVTPSGNDPAHIYPILNEQITHDAASYEEDFGSIFGNLYLLAAEHILTPEALQTLGRPTSLSHYLRLGLHDINTTDMAFLLVIRGKAKHYHLDEKECNQLSHMLQEAALTKLDMMFNNDEALACARKSMEHGAYGRIVHTVASLLTEQQKHTSKRHPHSVHNERYIDLITTHLIRALEAPWMGDHKLRFSGHDPHLISLTEEALATGIIHTADIDNTQRNG